ncbi:hypothetical protein Q3G72_010861 [Acer saccharum]|nr:hypothetical protein Q3G72_010861 [Acer saccharum]
MGNLRRGDLVWARVVYPHKWWPGLLLRTDSLGCFVSFFGFQNSRYFHPSEIGSFEQHFKLHINTCTASTCPTTNILLDRAFKFLGQNVAFSLKFPDRSRNPRRPSNLFRPPEVLGFVRTVAVLPWVEDDDFVIAVNVLAQITAFRHHHLVNSSDRSRMEAFLHSSEMTHAVVEDLDTSGMEENCRVGMEDEVFSEQVEKHFSASLIDRKKMSTLFLEKCLIPPNKDQLDIISTIQSKHCKTRSLREMLIKPQVPALNRFYLDKKCPNTLNWSVLSFGNLSNQTTFDICFKKRHPPERGEPQSFNSVYIESPLGVKVRKKTNRGKITLPCITHMEYNVKCLGLKRQLDQSVVSEPTLKLHKTLFFAINGADVCLWRSRKEDHADLSDTYNSADTISGPLELCNTVALSCNVDYAHLQRNITGCIAKARLKTQSVPFIAAQSSTHKCISYLMDFVGNMLNFSLLEYRSPKVLKLDEEDYSVDNSGTHISCADKQQPEQCEAILGSCLSDTHDATEKMLRPSDSQSVSNYETGIRTDDNKANDVGSGTRNEHETPAVSDDNSISIKINGGRSKNVENRELVKSVTFDSASKSQEAKQSEIQTTLAFSKSLLIKFPKNYSLPSKEELVKKFSPFGIIDSFSTKVYFYTGTARVVFLHQLDAAAAYQYAKRKKIFGEENVKFWLDPIEHKRGTKYPIRFSSLTAKLPDLKSCLKKSKSLMKKEKQCPRKVSKDQVTYDEMIPGSPRGKLAPRKSQASHKIDLGEEQGGESGGEPQRQNNRKSASLYKSSSSEQFMTTTTTTFNSEASSSSFSEAKYSPLQDYPRNTGRETLGERSSFFIAESPEKGDEENYNTGSLDENQNQHNNNESWMCVSPKNEVFQNSICLICKNRRPNVGWKRDFSCAELQKATESFAMKNFLSEGGFGSVYRGEINGLKIAVMQYKHASFQGEKEFKSEVQVLSKARHENVVMLLGSCSEGNQRLLVYEFVCNGSLNQHLSKYTRRPLSWEKRIKIAMGAAKGLQYLHENNIIHRDMRPNNILVTHDYESMLGEFGLARTQCGDSDHSSEIRVVGTLGYLAPEYAKCGKVSTKTDVYSFGVVLLQLITGLKTTDKILGGKSLVEWARPLLKERNYPGLIDPRILDSNDVHQLFWMVRVAEKCLSKNPQKRLPMDIVVDALKYIMEGSATCNIRGFSPAQSDSICSSFPDSSESQCDDDDESTSGQSTSQMGERNNLPLPPNQQFRRLPPSTPVVPSVSSGRSVSTCKKPDIS